MKSRKLAIPLILSIVLSTVGFAYAAWTDLVTIEGEAKMGTVLLAFDWEEPAKCVEYHREYPGGPLVEGEYLGKDVADCSAAYSGFKEDPHTGKFGYEQLDIVVINAYPSLHVFTTMIMRNIGTIPLFAYRAILTGEKYDNTGALICSLVQIFDPVDPQEFGLFEDYNGNGIQDDPTKEPLVMWARITNSWPVQIDPCHVEKREFDLHFLQPAQQCHTYEIHIRIDAIQWNKLYETMP